MPSLRFSFPSHPHPLSFSTNQIGERKCGNRNFNGGCKHKIVGDLLPFFRCELCDLDLCAHCLYSAYLNRQSHPSHQHPLARNYDISEWYCDGQGCKRNITLGVPRYRCDICDFDLCDQCLTSTSTQTFTHPKHPHPLSQINQDNGWACDGREFPGGCKRGITNFNQTKGVPRYRCDECDFDLCDQCLTSSSTSTRTFTHPKHPHPLSQINQDNGWACDGREFPGGCKRGITDFNQTKGVPRYRCDECDFDLCDQCLNNSIT
jgi:hypothetical protein